MQTIRWLKFSAVLQIIYVLFCVLSVGCFWMGHIADDWRKYFELGNQLVYGWVLNPTGPITLLVGMIFYFSERKDAVQRQLIGRKWIWFLFGFFFDLVLYLLSGCLIVGFTGGV